MLNFIQDVLESDKLSGNYIFFLLIIFYPFVNVIFLVSKYLAKMNNFLITVMSAFCTSGWQY